MLCLSRDEGEQILIGDELIRIRVMDIRAGDDGVRRVRLAIDAPKELSIVRADAAGNVQCVKRPVIG